jgi:hypothetical protein
METETKNKDSKTCDFKLNTPNEIYILKIMEIFRASISLIKQSRNRQTNLITCELNTQSDLTTYTNENIERDSSFNI